MQWRKRNITYYLYQFRMWDKISIWYPYQITSWTLGHARIKFDDRNHLETCTVNPGLIVALVLIFQNDFLSLNVTRTVFCCAIFIFSFSRQASLLSFLFAFIRWPHRTRSFSLHVLMKIDKNRRGTYFIYSYSHSIYRWGT